MGLFRTAGRAAVAGSVVGRVQRRQQQRFAAEDALAAAPPVVAATPLAGPSQPSSMDATDHKLVQLKQLGELRVAGVLTEEEFQGEKTKILAL
ncbi:SHOCT domain-containing protein [Paeniglutamicibacter gangotriensis]|uniref:SHOCT domain-containing protein n=1 Tax=Paeniglutamicibacter gangotriensis TaxID=254787 RepID=UPI0005B7C1FE|nr:SHOCT domain-containing protein [Paeniglutamicibacter gangotriensis]